MQGERGVSVSLVGLLIISLIIAYLFVKALTAYLGSSLIVSGDAARQVPVAADDAVADGGAVPTVGGDGTAVQATGVLEWTRQEVKAAGQRDLDRAKELTEYNF